MILNSPLKISARLLPALKLADAWLSFDPSTCLFYLDVAETEGRPTTKEHTITGFRPPACRYQNEEEFVRESFDAILSFMSACAEGIGYELRTGRKSENGDLFEADVAAWCYENRDAIDEASWELEYVGELEEPELEGELA